MSKIERVSLCEGISNCGKLAFCNEESENTDQDSMAQTSTCTLIIPKTNLINGLDNSITYFGRIADEIIRYRRIRSFIFEPKIFLSFGDLKYDLKNDEIILLESLLTQDYFDGLVKAYKSDFIKHNTYNTAEPAKTQTYSNIVDPLDDVNLTESSCIKPIRNVITGKWKVEFPEKSVELIYSNESANCSFDIILSLIKHYNFENSSVTVTELREKLLQKYLEYFKDYKSHIIIYIYTIS